MMMRVVLCVDRSRPGEELGAKKTNVISITGGG